MSREALITAATAMTMSRVDKIENLRLIENGLRHLCFELREPKPIYFRVAKEAHQVLYRTMIEALRGSDNAAIVGLRHQPKDHSVRYQTNNQPWQEVHKVAIPKCINAWRFSVPTPCASPRRTDSGGGGRKTKANAHLIGFYDALAMVQTDVFMGRFVHSGPIQVMDDESKILEWLHDDVRNEFEHFLPKLYSAMVIDLLEAAKLCLTLADKILFESNAIVFHSFSQKRLKNGLKRSMRGVLLARAQVTSRRQAPQRGANSQS